MNLQEIVAAVINNVTVCTDVTKIEAARSLGCTVDYISRREAKTHSLSDRSGFWSDLADAATLFLVGNGQVYRCSRSSAC
ncbi:MAG: hypothetical protein KDA60_09355 [Planctomycetales bacterium]|nr:hypothetical protein [Planctomycetales bacterium]